MDPTKSTHFYKVKTGRDVQHILGLLENFAKAAGMPVVKRTQLVTAASELLTNVIKYAGEGSTHFRLIDAIGKKKIEITVKDDGPGIPDVELAMSKGFTTSNTLGVGLPGAKALSDEFRITTAAGMGTKVTIAKWV